ncbi:hypothetical protein [uncultured Shewanella sp.]|uniref:hypothetical protein n=1 Tax=uncultured Shewanella sp. TaxID=173975 RepID=UPI00260F0052|nr:hypothetical protein [uncultured Shewanella sp.]
MKLKQSIASVTALLTALILLAPMAQAAKLKSQNLTQLIDSSESIISGQVEKVTDGLTDKGIPYTEVSIKIGSAAKGQHAKNSTYTFRQFGLLKPRVMSNGRQMLAMAPEGFPRWNKGETVIAFMYKSAKQTGLRTTAGMAHGKFNLVNGNVVNEFNNEGIFNDVEFAPGLLTHEEQNMMTNPTAISATFFMSVVGRAVSQQWIDNGKMK